uniref:RNase III domain-containing protein n=1 Tax=Meloidogyne hapla TaxID=6305 RepID=A0A1I8BF63_MELHA
MDNPDINLTSCENSCWKYNKAERLVPDRCKHLVLKAGRKQCWKRFCKICNETFKPIYTNVGESSTSGSGQHVESNWEEGESSSSQNFPNQLYDNIQNLFGAMYLNDRYDKDNIQLLLMFNEKILKNVIDICGNQNHEPWRVWFCTKANRIERTIYDAIPLNHRHDFQVDIVFNGLAKHFSS